MAFRWEEYFELAKKINETFKGEAARRTVISRVYYSMFCLARDCICLKKLRYNVHSTVIKKLKEGGNGCSQENNRKDVRFIKAGGYLNKLRELRIISDYKTDKEITEDDVVRALSLAEKIYNILVQVCPNLTRERSDS